MKNHMYQASWVQFSPSALINVRVVELVDTPVLETGAERHVGSSPTLDTIKFIKKICLSMRTKQFSAQKHLEIQIKRLMIDLKIKLLEMDIPVGTKTLELNCGSNKHDEDKHL